ncbi:MAG: hypothetical protein LBU48_01365 [Coriobacteriales bacterium]|jgi:hypothetical protein|nr:hypothetical protein [Coriobacteriales bacterium]
MDSQHALDTKDASCKTDGDLRQQAVASPLLTRRSFLAGLLGAGAAAVTGVALTATGCSPGPTNELESIVSQGAQDATIETLNVPTENVLTSDDFQKIPVADVLTLQRTFDLPAGCLLYQSCPSFITALVPGEKGGALIRLGFVNLETGTLTIALQQALGHDTGSVIYDARASETALIWVESDFATGSWQVYLAALEGIPSAENDLAQLAQLVDEGDQDYEPPLLCVSGSKAYWTVMPDPNGPASTADSYLKAATVFSATEISEVSTVHTSHGRMITNPQATSGIVTFVPRVDTSGIYYQITALKVEDDTRVAVSILPQSMRVSDAVYMGDGFTFCTENNYDYAAGLRYFGTYEQLADGRYLHVGRMPTSAAVRWNGYLVVKSTHNVIGLDAATGQYFVIDTPQNCVDYGDILVHCGVQDKIIVYTTVANVLDSEAQSETTATTRVRIFAAISAEPVDNS